MDLEEIADYIARENPRRALSFIGEIRKRCQSLVTFPEAAPLREDFGAGLRMVPLGRYLIFYTVHPDAVRVERILAGERLLSSDHFSLIGAISAEKGDALLREAHQLFRARRGVLLGSERVNILGAQTASWWETASRSFSHLFPA